MKTGLVSLEKGEPGKVVKTERKDVMFTGGVQGSPGPREVYVDETVESPRVLPYLRFERQTLVGYPDFFKMKVGVP